MTKQIINTNSPDDLINVGNTANDRRGDSLRAAFVKLNDAADKIDANFTELYAHTASDATDRLVNGTKELVLNVDGSITLPGDDVSITAPGQNLSINAANYVYIDSLGAGQIEIGTNTVGGVVVLGSATANLVARSSLIFENITDEITFTGANRLGFNANTTIASSTSAVIFTAPSAITAIKLVIIVEGQVDGDITGVQHTQTCEASIAATHNTNTEPVMSVYGSVYTSIAPLATFSVSRGLNNEIEVLATNAQTTEALHVRAQSIQFVSYFD